MVFFRMEVGMNNVIRKSVHQIVGDFICVDAEDGKKVYEVLASFIQHEKPVILSFLNVKMLTSAFLNTAIGALYGDFTEEQIKQFITIEDMQQTDIMLLKRVVDTAKLYYRDPERMERSIEEILEEK